MPAVLALASIVYLKGETAEARQLLQRAIRLRPSSAIAHAHLAHMTDPVPGLNIAQQPAFRHASEALRIRPGLPVALLVRGHILGDARLLDKGPAHLQLRADRLSVQLLPTSGQPEVANLQTSKQS